MKNNLYLPVIFLLSFISLSPAVEGQILLVPFDSVEVTRSGELLDNPWAGGLNCPQFSELDLDLDGKKDLVIFERNFYGAVKTFINTGATGEIGYHYAPEYQARFPQMRNWMLLRDFNCDGKEDIFTSVPAGVAVYRNDTGPDGKLQFTLVTSLLQTVGLDGQTPLYVSPPDIPAIVDVDNDGDLDFLSFNILGSTVEYHKNFSMENHGNCDYLEYELKNACWGYFSEDGTTNTVTLFDTCEMNVPDPEKSSLHAGSTILALDLTGDGVKELVLGDITYNNLVMLTNGGTTTSAGIISFATDFPSNSVPVDLTVFPAAYFMDVDNDGLNDLLVAPNNPNTAENYDNIWHYRNTGSNSIPEFVFQGNTFLQDGMLDAGERSFPAFFDENGDGLQDILMGNFGYFLSSGNYSSRLMLLRNTGTAQEPAYEVVTDDYLDLSVYGFDGIYPAFGDLDGDGDSEMVIGDEEGHLHYFRNDGGAGNPADFVLIGPNYKGIDIGQSAKPQLIDVDRDGLTDMLVGERGGTVNFFQNIGSPEMADFSAAPTIEQFGGVDVMPECCTGYSSPFMAEDSTGSYLMYVGSEQGKIYLYNDIENNLEGSFTLVDSLYLNAINVTVSGSDINDDGRLEVAFGQYGGGAGLLKYGIPQGLGILDNRVNSLGVSLAPNPAGQHVRITVNEMIRFPIKTAVVEVITTQGNILLNDEITLMNGSTDLLLGKLPKGLYFIRVMTVQGSGVRKLMIK